MLIGSEENTSADILSLHFNRGYFQSLGNNHQHQKFKALFSLNFSFHLDYIKLPETYLINVFHNLLNKRALK